jgi:hypothetical protein
MTIGRKHRDDEEAQERIILRSEYGPEPRTPEAKPTPRQDPGTDCPVCGRRGRAEGHH